MSNRAPTGKMPLPLPPNEFDQEIAKANDQIRKASEAADEGTRPDDKFSLAGEHEVIAIRPGFYDNMRRTPGHVFTIAKYADLGNWMQLTDAKAEKQRRAADEKEKAAGK